VLGAVLPDLASMAGVRVDRPRITGPLAAGIRFHHVADAAFHGEGAFVAGTIALRRDLDAAGVRPASARAIAHVGWELLLDGTLAGTDAEARFWRAMALAPGAADGLTEGTRERWLPFVRRWQPRFALRYDDPGWVADRVHDMLQRRPRLAFDAGGVVTVAAVLAAHQPSVRAAALPLFDAVAAATTP
jgi:hypothetical protein